MKHVRMFHLATLSILLMATATPGLAQLEDKSRSPVKPDKHTQASASQKRQKQSLEKRPASAPGKTATQLPQAPQRVQTDEQRIAWQQHGASSFDSQHQTWTERGGYQGLRVPDDSFSKSFGRDHSFHVFGLPYAEVEGRPRFQYSGYWFSMMEPYPEYWGPDWYRNDDMYVDYDGGGYYLYDRRFSNRPGVAVSISF